MNTDPKVRLTKQGLRDLNFYGSRKKKPQANDNAGEQGKEAPPELKIEEVEKAPPPVIGRLDRQNESVPRGGPA